MLWRRDTNKDLFFHLLSFISWMNPLLVSLQQSGLGLSMNNFYAGDFLHADDIKMLASSTDSLKRQISIVEDFSKENLLRLNLQKCEIVNFALPVMFLNITQSQFLIYQKLWLQNVLNIGGLVTCWQPAPLKRTSRRPGAALSIMAPWVPSMETSIHCLPNQ